MNRLIYTAVVLALFGSTSLVRGADVTERQWVRVSDSGTIQGRAVVPRNEGISAVRNAKISLIDQDGRDAAKAVKSDKTGRFSLVDVSPGVYTLMIQGENAFACCAMHVVRADVPISDEFEIAAGSVEYAVVRDAMDRYLQPGQVTNVVFDPSNNPMTTDRVATGESLRVSQHDGGLKGRLTRAGFTDDLSAGRANVLIYRDGVQVARTVTDVEGNFMVGELAPGSYSVLGSGKDGFGLMGVELIDPLTSPSVRNDLAADTTLVMQSQEANDTFIMQIAPGPITVIDDRLIDEEEIGPAVPFDGNPLAFDGGVPMGGGGGGGGGGGFGGGGLGGIALVGGVAAAIAIGASNDDGNLIVSPPESSPSSPINTPTVTVNP